jgi:hypothetical protein
MSFSLLVLRRWLLLLSVNPSPPNKSFTMKNASPDANVLDEAIRRKRDNKSTNSTKGCATLAKCTSPRLFWFGTDSTHCLSAPSTAKVQWLLSETISSYVVDSLSCSGTILGWTVLAALPSSPSFDL